MTNTRKILMSASALAGALSIALTATAASAETKTVVFDLPAQPLGESLRDFYRESGEQIVFSEDLVAGRTSPALKGSYTADQALAMLLEGTTLTARRTSTGVVMIEAPQSGSAAGDGADSGTVQALIVTAQKREEQIQDVPIAISAFTEKTLQEQKIEGGFDLLKAIPNVTFSKNNFTSYNFSIRGIGTKAVSATTDPGVAVSFNNIALLQNRLFEQEYFDVERVEVLRGPQGTLYGRNATAGVINVISAKPNLQEFSGWLKGEVGNYHTKRVSAMVNVPLIEDKLAIRFAGALTDRQGYDYNSVTKNHVNGRDLWSARLTVGFNPTEHIRSNLVWERFNEDDNRSRTGKQLCHRDPGMATIGNTPIPLGGFSGPLYEAIAAAKFSQGCKPGSLYEDAAFETPNGLALPFVQYAVWPLSSIGYLAGSTPVAPLMPVDPYADVKQSRDLHTIASLRDPRYRAKADVVELNFDVDLTDSLTLTSQTAYNKDSTYSFQDYNRYNTQPIFQDTSNLTSAYITDGTPTGGGPSEYVNLAPGGVFCDPQLGCTNAMVTFDIAQAKGRQFTQEVRLQSDYSGPVNFSAGATYTRFQTLVDYYVFSNVLTVIARISPFNGGSRNPGGDITKCPFNFFLPFLPSDVDPGTVDINDPHASCPYVDPNPIESINGEGHNYFRSKNPYTLKSAAAFGEIYWQATDALKVTAGLRYTDDRKTFVPVPSQILLARYYLGGGTVSKGYPELPPIKQHWGEWTGRLGVDWKPKLSFTDQTMLYAFYSRGYKGGGANPPAPGFATAPQDLQIMQEDGYSQDVIDFIMGLGAFPMLTLTANEYQRTFKPEFVNAFEIGAKNTLLGGAMTLNGDVFFYDYKDYQVSQIRDRTAVNENFDARTWGLELQSTFTPSRNLQLLANVGYLDTRIGDGETSIDLMDRTQGNSDYIVTKPWVQLPSNCVVPKAVVEYYFQQGAAFNQSQGLCGGWGYGNLIGRPVIDPATGAPYDPADYPEINGGAGLLAHIGGNELPNAPHWTVNVGGQYGFDLVEGWRATVRGDAYWQSQSWARVYNDNPYDKLHGWYNVNLSAWIENENGLKIEFYAKNLLDKTPITDSFLNSDDSDLTTNVFVLDPRLIGLSIRKEF